MLRGGKGEEEEEVEVRGGTKGGRVEGGKEKEERRERRGWTGDCETMDEVEGGRKKGRERLKDEKGEEGKGGEGTEKMGEADLFLHTHFRKMVLNNRRIYSLYRINDTDCL